MSQQWDLAGKTVIVTGANVGLGKVTVIELLKLNVAKVIMACRNMTTANETAGEIRRQFGFSDGDEGEGRPQKIAVRHLDLASFKSIRKFADTIKEEEQNLHVLINNAGINPPEDKRITEDGFELCFQTNYLGQVYLTHLLMDLLKKSAPSRIIVLSSEGYKFCWPKGLIVDDLQFEKRKFDSWQAYCQSKLAFLLYCKKLSEILKNDQISVFSVHPGMVQTNILRDRSKAWQFFVDKIVAPLGFIVITPEKGVRTTIYCAKQAGIEQFSGGYFENSKHTSLMAMAEDEEKMNQLWDFTQQCLDDLSAKTTSGSVE